ncbi:MAG TPA: DEAD/DEAH box helicase [Thermoanaerobaculia bacterium]|jgi:superfamily II DNA or RNA helicase
MLADHQLAAVARLRELLAKRRGALLADDVGLGKSFIAAALAAEVCGRGGEVDLVVPVALVEQWRETLQRFGVTANVLTHDALAGAPFVPLPRDRLVIADEAHAFRNPRTRRYAALARRSVGAQLLLVTATPVCNGIDDLEALVRLIARDDLLADAGVPSIDAAFAARDREQLARIVAVLVIRRQRDVLPDALRFGALERRVVRHPLPEAGRLIDTLRFPLVGEHAILRRFLWRRLESSEVALLESLRRQRRFYERVLASGRAMSKRDYRRAFGHDDSDVFQQVLFWDLFAPPATCDAEEIGAEVARLDALAGAIRATPPVKRELLLAVLRDVREPALIFTGSVATARELREVLGCGLITASERSREAVLRAFREGKLDVVVSTDLAAEGLNLQRAGVVVHYDIPWNPVKLQQRNGRAHRIGQTREAVRAVYFLPERDETRIIRTMASKDRVRRRVLVAEATGDRTDRSVCPTSGQRNVGPTPLSVHSARTLRPRLTREAAAVRFLEAARGFVLPAALERRHKAGVELLLTEMAGEYLDQRRVDDLLAVLE